MGERLTYRPLALPDRVQLPPDASLRAARAFRDYMRRRHSVRDFSDAPVAAEVIAACIDAAGSAPSGANQQPWHFAAIRDEAMKARIRAAAEQEERAFYAGGGGDAWLAALEPVGTGPDKPHLTAAPWLIGGIALFTLPALWDLWRNPAAGIILSDENLEWFSGRLDGNVALAQIDRIRMDTRWDLSVRVTIMTRNGKSLRLPLRYGINSRISTSS